MTKIKRKKQTHKFLIAWLSVIIAFLLIVVCFFAFASPVQETIYFHSKELGVVETKITIYHWYNSWMKVFQQETYFLPEVEDATSIDYKCKMGQLYVDINLSDGGTTRIKC